MKSILNEMKIIMAFVFCYMLPVSNRNGIWIACDRSVRVGHPVGILGPLCKFRTVQVREALIGRKKLMRMSDDEIDNEDTVEEDEGELIDWQLPLCFMKKRHKEKIEGTNCLPQTWRMKERVSTDKSGLLQAYNYTLPLCLRW